MQDTFKKTIKIILSCNTCGQLYTAKRYIKLAKVDKSRVIIGYFELQKEFIQERGGGVCTDYYIHY